MVAEKIQTKALVWIQSLQGISRSLDTHLLGSTVCQHIFGMERSLFQDKTIKVT